MYTYITVLISWAEAYLRLDVERFSHTVFKVLIRLIPFDTIDNCQGP